MKTIAPAFQAELEGVVATLATCWKITRTDGIIMSFTEHDKDLTVSSIVYSAKSGYTGSAIAQAANLAVDNMDLEGLIADAGITAEDIRRGAYNYAAVEVFLVNYNDPDGGKIILRRGLIGELTLRGGVHVTEIRGLAQYLTRIFLEVVMPECLAELYDARCKVVSTAFENTGTIATIVVDRRSFTVTLDAPARLEGYHNGGLISFTSGDANGKSMEVRLHGAGDTFTLYLASPWALQVGDTFLVKTGCDKLKATCKDKFSNLINFRGFPEVPGTDKILDYPDGH